MTDHWDRWREMGLATLQGERAQGFFTPYRYADQVRAPSSYPAVEAQFDLARSNIECVLDDIDAAANILTALNGPPPIPRWTQSWFPRLDGAAAYAICQRHILVNQAAANSFVQIVLTGVHSDNALRKAIFLERYC